MAVSGRLGLPGPAVIAHDHLLRRNEYLETHSLQLQGSVAKQTSHISGLRGTLEFERVERNLEQANMISWHKSCTKSQSEQYATCIKSLQARVTGKMLQLASRDAATVSSLRSSIRGLEEELSLQAAELTRRHQAEVEQRDVAHAHQVASLGAEIERLNARLAATEELSAQRGLRLEAQRKTLRQHADENLAAQRELRVRLRAQSDATASALSLSLAETEDEKTRQAQWYQLRDEETREECRQMTRGHAQEVHSLEERALSLVAAAGVAAKEHRDALIADGASREAGHAQSLEELRAIGVDALARQDGSLRAEMRWEREAAREERRMQDLLIDELRIRLREEEGARVRDVAELSDRLAEDVAALAVSRHAWNGVCADASRAGEERRRDQQLRTRVQRQQAIERLEGWPRAMGVA